MKEIYDLIVVGGGFAGVCAAMAAAEQGARVLLVEKFNCLGGMAASGLVLPFMGYWTKLEQGNTSLAGGMFGRILKELTAVGGLGEDGKIFDEELLKLVLNRMCQKSGVQLLFNTTIVQAQMDGRRIVSLRGWGKSSAVELSARHFVDATGDAELAVLAGCGCRVGRESDGLCQPMTLSFRLGGVDRETFLKHKPEINPLYRKLQEQGKIKNPRENVLSFRTMHEDVIHMNSTRVVRRDPTDPFDVTMAELEAREQVFELYHMLKEYVPGCEHSYVQATGLQIGIRESRMVDGLYTLTVEDLKGLARFPDAIAAANYDIDIHNPEGAGTDHYYFGDGEWYEIPYRCLVPKDCDNLLVAGRCISSTHEAQASYRIMPFCAQLGQAAGTAVSVALDTGKELPEVDVERLRTLLRADGFMI